MKKVVISLVFLVSLSNISARYEHRRAPHYRPEPFTSENIAHHTHNLGQHLHTSMHNLHSDAQEALSEAIQESTQTIIHSGLRRLMNGAYAIGNNIHQKITGNQTPSNPTTKTPSPLDQELVLPIEDIQ